MGAVNACLGRTLCAVLMLFVGAAGAGAHGVVGARFFPATMATDDPFAADELALPTITLFKQNEEAGSGREADYEFEWSKTIVANFAVSFAGGYVDTPLAKGWENLEVTPIVTFLRSPEHEFIASADVNVEIGGSGSTNVADQSSTVSPEILFGKGLGDLPDSLAPVRPVAITGRLAYAIPANSSGTKVLEWGGAVEYSLLYLTNNVRDIGLGRFASRLTPLVEFNLQSPIQGYTTGTINPGILWSGQYMQFGVEALVPVNAQTGRNIGMIAQLHFYLDDIFPDSIGRPLFGDSR